MLYSSGKHVLPFLFILFARKQINGTLPGSKKEGSGILSPFTHEHAFSSSYKSYWCWWQYRDFFYFRFSFSVAWILPEEVALLGNLKLPFFGSFQPTDAGFKAS